MDMLLCNLFKVSKKQLFSERMSKILVYAHHNGHDPIGLYHHFLKWKHAAESKRLPAKIVFVSLQALSVSSLDIQLRSFLNLPHNLPFLPFKQRNQTSTDMKFWGKRGESSLGIEEYNKRIFHGFNVLKNLSQSIEAYVRSSKAFSV